MRARLIISIVLVVAGSMACLGATSDHMNYYLIPGSIAVLLGAGVILWDYFRSGPKSTR